MTQPGHRASAGLNDRGALVADVTDVAKFFIKYTAEACFARR